MLRQLVVGLVTMWFAVTLAFFALRLLPGDAIAAQLSRGGASESEIQQARTALGLDAPVIVQYSRFLVDLARGDLGESLISSQPVTLLIGSRIGHTAALALAAMLTAVVLGLGLGMAASGQRVTSAAARFIFHLSVSTPIYWTATLALLLFAVWLGWLPSAGSDTWQHLVLPVGVLGFHVSGAIARVTDLNLRALRHAPFIITARGKGLPEGVVLGRHLLRVALLPVIPIIALQTGFLFGGTVITESVFVRPGLGQLLLTSVINRDYPVVQAIVILSAGVYIGLNLLADFLQRLLDPRLSA